MGLVYAPQHSNQKPFKPDVFRQFQPRFSSTGSRLGGIVSGAYQIGRFLFKNRRLIQGPTVVATGAGLSAGSTGLDDLVGQTNNQFGKTYRTNHIVIRGNGRRRKRHHMCCCPRPKRNGSKRNPYR